MADTDIFGDPDQREHSLRIQEYLGAFPKNISPEYRDCPILTKIFTSDAAKTVFANDSWTGIKMEPVHINFTASLPPYLRMKCRNIPTELLPAAKLALDQYVETGYLERANDGTYGAALVVVRKPDGSARLCGDYRAINKHATGIPLMMPDVQTELENMQPFSLFTELDWATAFHQIPLDHQSSERLAISTQWGIYRPRFVPEGITCGSALLMTHAQRIFQDFRPWALALHDNLLIGATDLNDMAIKISKIIHRCQENQIQLKMSKSKIAYTSIPFFGYVLNQGSYTSDPQRLSDISAIHFPKSLTQLQSFLGMLNYVSPFIPMFAEKIAPINAMNST